MTNENNGNADKNAAEARLYNPPLVNPPQYHPKTTIKGLEDLVDEWEASEVQLKAYIVALERRNHEIQLQMSKLHTNIQLQMKDFEKLSGDYSGKDGPAYRRSQGNQQDLIAAHDQQVEYAAKSP